MCKDCLTEDGKAKVVPGKKKEKEERFGDQPLKIDNCDNAIIGVATRCGAMPLLVYDYDLLIQVFVEEQEMEEMEAVEWIDYNIEGAWMGEGTPLILHKGSLEEIQDYLEY